MKNILKIKCKQYENKIEINYQFLYFKRFEMFRIVIIALKS